MKSIKNIFLIFQIILLYLICCKRPENGAGQDKFTVRRKMMVETQILARGIKDSLVIKALLKVPRHEFVPAEHKEYAYYDSALPIGEKQTISQPYIVAYMTEMLNLEGHEKVLEIGTGSGYQAAVLAEIVRKVYSIEIIEKIGKNADKTLGNLGYNNINLLIGDGYDGWPSESPFDAVIVTAAPPKIPQPLVDQLKPGGRMIIPVGSVYQNLMLIEKTGEGIVKSTLIPVRFVPMTGKILR